MNIRKARRLANRLLNRYLLSLEGWTFEFDNANRRRGCCRHHTKVISLSKGITRRLTEPYVLDTILHEISHALVGVGHGHGKTWKNRAISIGCSGKRLADDTITMPTRYIGYCPNCNSRFTRHRITEKGCCGKCCKKYNKGKAATAYMIKWREVKR